MTVSTPPAIARRFDLTVGEVTGAIGDTVTVLPLIVAAGLLTPASLPHLLFGFAAFQVVWGAVYGVPLSVEPMKALAGLLVAGSITHGELVAAGLIAGGVLLFAGRAGLLSAIGSAVGEPVVRGVQLAVAGVLAVAAAELLLEAPRVAAAGTLVALAVASVSRRAVALVLLCAGFSWSVAVAGVPGAAPPAVAAFPAGGPALSVGVAEGLVAQLPMTVGNAAVATSLLLADLYGVDVPPDRLAESMGGMNILAVPLGAFPMCHGSGGLAGKHAFGARSGTANLVAGGIYALLAVFAGALSAFPTALLGVLLAAVAASLARVALAETDRRALVVAVGALGVAANVGAAFLAGAVWWRLRG